MKKLKYSKEAVNLIAERMPDEFLKQFVLLWLGTNKTLEQIAEELNYSSRQIQRYTKKVHEFISQMPDIVNGDIKHKNGGVSMVDGHIDEPKKPTNYDRIRNMSVEEMAETIKNSVEDCEKHCAFTKNGRCNSFGDGDVCAKGIELWLESEVDTE